MEGDISPEAVHPFFFSNKIFSQKHLDFAKTFDQVEKNHLTLLVLSILGRFFNKIQQPDVLNG